MLFSAETTAIEAHYSIQVGEVIKKLLIMRNEKWAQITRRIVHFSGSNIFFVCRPFDWRVHFRN